MVYCDCLENSWVKAPGVRIPLLPLPDNGISLSQVCLSFPSQIVERGSLITSLLTMKLTIQCYISRSFTSGHHRNTSIIVVDSWVGVSFYGG